MVEIRNAVETAKVLQVMNPRCAGMSVDAICEDMQRCVRSIGKPGGYIGTMGFYIMHGYVGGDRNAGVYYVATLAAWLVASWMENNKLLPKEG